MVRLCFPTVRPVVLSPAEVAALLLRFGSSVVRAQIAEATRRSHACATSRGHSSEESETIASSTGRYSFTQRCLAENASRRRDRHEGDRPESAQSSTATETLHEEPPKRDRRVFIFDASWSDLPVFGGRDAAREFRHGARLPHAVFFNVDACSDRESPFPHMMPGATEFAVYLTERALEARAREVHAGSGVAGSSVADSVGEEASEREREKRESGAEFDDSDENATFFSKDRRNEKLPSRPPEVDLERDIFIVYDGVGVFSSPRVYFMLKAFGCANVFLLDGGIKRWIAEGYPTERGPLSAVGFGERETFVSSARGTTSHDTGPPDLLIQSAPHAVEMVEAAQNACNAAVDLASRGDAEAAEALSEKAAAAAVASGVMRAAELPPVRLATSSVATYDAIVSHSRGVHTPDAGRDDEEVGARGQTPEAPEEGARSSGEKGVDFLLVDARVPGRFFGTEPEPRGDVPSGHIPGSLNLPFPAVLETKQFDERSDTGADCEPLSPFASSPTEKAFAWHTLKKGEKLREALQPVFTRVGGALLKTQEHEESQRASRDSRDSEETHTQVVVTCGSGMTACVLYVALVEAGVDPRALAVYDGSWAEYATRRLLEHDGEGIIPRLNEQEASEWRTKILHARLSGNKEL
ncbi:thiosulfate sulfurtransferase [Toxoplasma gondii MAS]|uniref:Thiosulfate sulfurtransferase n=2 Tax=Toxoplasma gondii TaxID=5811 RepID=A0A086Q9V6_TOXGO|nr:thiosulfate sulfurtransferase [Toxoplasma gondii MAS]PUA86041.1 thiosulfate sulfurtransferase [Toxoplasma gondii TgCATBr9]